MAEVDFGENEEREEMLRTRLLRTRLQESEALNQKLVEEIKRLKRNLNIIMRPSGVTIDDVNVDGPVVQILYADIMISKKCRHEIEDAICNIILKNQKVGNTPYFLKAQPPAFALEEDLHNTSITSTPESFKLVGSVQHFTNFSVDKRGQPLLNETPEVTDGWEVPVYQRVFNQVMGADGQEIEMKDKRPKNLSFKCGTAGHQLRDCPQPKDLAAINERRSEFSQNSDSAVQGNRYHEVEESVSKYKPGLMSEELLSAPGKNNRKLPPLMDHRRQLSYRPKQKSTVSNDGSSTEDSHKLSFDFSKLMDFCGFNVPRPQSMTESGSASKRKRESNSSPRRRKKNRSSPERSFNLCSDVEVESDPGTSYNNGSEDFQFQAPPPPTPPANGSPAVKGQSLVQKGTVDELSLEELKELVRAALESLGTATNSHCETPATGTPAPSSSSVTSSAQVDTEPGEAGPPQSPGPFKALEDTPKSPGPAAFPESTSVRLIKTDAESLSVDLPLFPVEEDDDDVERNVPIPHRSNFAAGIDPFEESMDYTVVAEATGRYRKIRDLLKGSPFSVSRQK